MGWSEGRPEGRGGNGREDGWGRPTRRAYGDGDVCSTSDGSINHGKADEDADDELGAGDAEEEEGEDVVRVRLARSWHKRARQRSVHATRLWVSFLSAAESILVSELELQQTTARQARSGCRHGGQGH